MKIEQLLEETKEAEKTLSFLAQRGTETLRAHSQWCLSINSTTVQAFILDQQCRDDLADALANYKERLRAKINAANKKFEAINQLLEGE